MNKYFSILAYFRGLPYSFFVSHRTYLKTTNKDIAGILNKNFLSSKNQCAPAEINYTKREVSKEDYEISTLEKFELDVPVRIV